MTDLVGLQINNKYLLTKVLGAGSFATVYEAKEGDGALFAIKAFVKSEMTESQLNFVKNEFKISKHVSKHPNIVSTYEAIDTQHYFFIVMEHCKNGDLFDLLAAVGKLPDDTIKTIMLDTISALQYCHQYSIYHRDVKPENLLIGDDYRIRLADFGLATTRKYAQDFTQGTYGYMSKECLNEDNTNMYYSTEKNDVWSVGVLLWTLLKLSNMWELPSKNDVVFQAFMTHPKSFFESFDFSEQIAHVFVRALELKPRKRATLEELSSLIQAINVEMIITVQIEERDTYLDTVKETSAGKEKNLFNKKAGLQLWMFKELLGDALQGFR